MFVNGKVLNRSSEWYHNINPTQAVCQMTGGVDVDF